MTKRVALVTGGNGGIGSAICRELAVQGNLVVAGYFPPEKESAEAWQKEMADQGISIELAGMDVSSYEDSERAIAEVAEKFGPVEILVNCAGITRDAMFHKMTPEQWHAVINTNLNRIFNMTKQVYGKMVERGWGRIVNISSVNGIKGQAGQANYSATKAAVYGFTKSLAQECAKKGVTVNSISPGYIGTEMVRAIREDVLAKIVATIPVGRLGEPSEIARTVAFMTAEDAGFLTGEDVTVNGGLYFR